jgi:hypothetical protein
MKGKRLSFPVVPTIYHDALGMSTTFDNFPQKNLKAKMADKFCVFY